MANFRPGGDILAELLRQNKAWKHSVDEKDPDFFKHTAEKQTPEVLWIGCADETLQIAELGVEHIIVAGHTRCGGVAACIDGASAADKAECFGIEDEAKIFGPTEPRETSHWPPPYPLDVWLASLRELALSYRPQPPTVLELVKANVRQQVANILQSEVVKNAWAGTGRGKLVGVHGWMYRLEDGLVQDLGCSVLRSTPTADV